MTTNERSEFIAGLRALADFYETNPEMPLPDDVYGKPQMNVFTLHGRERFVSGVRMLGGVRAKRWTDKQLHVSRDFGGVTLKLVISRDDVCDTSLDQRTGEYRSSCPPLLAPVAS